jgi:hypothetical protein
MLTRDQAKLPAWRIWLSLVQWHQVNIQNHYLTGVRFYPFMIGQVPSDILRLGGHIAGGECWI